ncbi:MAG: alpha/beta hydrolase [Alphaproteobacteria bacterium]|nr:alpha/beta hydrolase [Alphaproteobacteria bacterium]
MGKERGFDIHPDMRELLDAKEAAQQAEAANDARGSWNNYAAAMQRDYPTEMIVTNTTLPCAVEGVAQGAPARIYRFADTPVASPCIVYIHGGAFIKGSLDSGDPIAWGIADVTRLTVVSIDYRLAPENPFPCGVEDCFAAIQYILRHAAELGLDPHRIALWGDSAGANMAAASCLMARDRGRPNVAATVLVYPCLTDDLSAPTYRHFADAPVPTSAMDRAWTLYLGARRPTQDPYAAPLKAKNLSSLPPTFVHVAEIDCLADDGRAYAAKLHADRTQAKLRVARRMIHGFLRARFTGADAAAEFRAPCDFIMSLFEDGGRNNRLSGPVPV